MAQDNKNQKPNSGIVNSAASEYKAPDIKPVTTQVDAETETVESRLNKLTSGGSRYVNQAKTTAMREANSRGLVNSTMAAGAGVEAAIKNAMPIAQQDAKTYTETRRDNQNVQNQFLENRQNTSLNMESNAQNSNLNINEANNQSSLNIDEANNQSGLTIEENKALNELQIKRDTIGSQLTREEQTLLTDLEMKRDAAASELAKSEAEFKSGLSIEESRVLNDLQMKRDAGLSELTIEEQSRLNDLQIKRDNNTSELTKEEEILRNELAMQRDNLLSDLSKKEEAWSTELRTVMEQTLNDEKFSDETKRMYVASIDAIIRDTNAQITTLSTSDASGPQQAAAIKAAEESRDAQIAVYQNLLESYDDWDWSTDFTPEKTESAVERDTSSAGYTIGETVNGAVVGSERTRNTGAGRIRTEVWNGDSWEIK